MRETWLWGVKFKDGRYVPLKGETIEEAVGSIGNTMAEVRRYLPLKKLEEEDKVIK